MSKSARWAESKTAGEEKAKMVLSASERRGPEETDLSRERHVPLPQAGVIGWAPFAGA
jgi:hypothetical protein